MAWIGKQKGFSLMELLIVIALLSVISLVAIPGIMSWLPNYRLKKAAQDLRSDFQRAKLAAVKERMTCAIEFVGGDNPTGYVVYLDEDDDQEQDGNEPVISQVDWASDYSNDVRFVEITFEKNGGGNAWNGFRPTGLPRNAANQFGGGRIQWDNENGSWREVRLSASGNVQIRGNFEGSATD